MQSYYIKPKAFYDSFGDVQPSQPYNYSYGDRPVFEFSFLPNEIAEGDTLVFAIDNDMVFYDSTPENLFHSASCMVVCKHDVTAEEATAGKVQMRIETRTVKFRDVTNGKVRPVEVVSGLYRKRGSDDDINYVLLAKGRAMANGIIADYDALPEPITTNEYYTKDEIDGLLDEKADEDDLTAHTGDTDIHVTLQDKSTWDSKADITDIGTATVTLTQGGTSMGSFSVNATDNVTIDLNDGAQADWAETDPTEASFIRSKPQFIPNYFAVTAKQADSTVKMMTMQDVMPDIEYSTDGGSTWTQLVFTQSEQSESLYFSQTITLANNAKALFRGDNHTIGNGWSGVSRFLFTGQVAVSGKLMSLLDKSCASDTVPNDVTTGVFANLFSCTNWTSITFEDNMYALVDASELVFPINSYNNAYMYLFRDCKGLTKVPNCFYQGANVSNGLRSMLENSGITGKVVLGLTGQLATSVYTGLFEGCAGITNAEILNCIPARNSFLDTFEGCSNLTEITVHFTEWNDSWQWRNPPATGVWRCPKALDVTNRGMTGIPSGWTIEYIDEQSVQSDWTENSQSSPAFILHKPDIIEAPAVAGSAGQVLTATSGAPAWMDIPADADVVTSLNNTITILTNEVGGQISNKNYFHVTAKADSLITFRGMDYNNGNSFEFSYDRRTWNWCRLPYTFGLNAGETMWIRNAGEPNGWDFVNKAIISGDGNVSMGGDMLSLVSQTIDTTKTYSNGGRRMHKVFSNFNALTEIESGFENSISGFVGNAFGFFDSCTNLATIASDFTIPTDATNIERFFYQCSSLTSLPNGFIIPSTVTNVGHCLENTGITSIGNNVSINPSANNEGGLNKNNITSIGTNFSYMTSYTTSSASGQAVFPNATIGSGWSIYQYSDGE